MILGGAFFVNGNINPAAEANIYGDPEAADFVLGQPASIRMVGLDVTHEVNPCLAVAGVSSPHVDSADGAGACRVRVAPLSWPCCST